MSEKVGWPLFRDHVWDVVGGVLGVVATLVWLWVIIRLIDVTMKLANL